MAAPAAAQQKEPIGRFAVDCAGSSRGTGGPTSRRVSRSRTATCPSGASASPAARTLPMAQGRSSSVVGGRDRAGKPHARPARRGRQADDAGDEEPDGPAALHVHRAGVLLNFGHRNGWSYISGGMFGRAKLTPDRSTCPGPAPMRKTLNYGGGARWFINQRMAFSVDVRWYDRGTRAAERSCFCPESSAQDDAHTDHRRDFVEIAATEAVRPIGCFSSGRRSSAARRPPRPCRSRRFEAWPFKKPVAGAFRDVAFMRLPELLHRRGGGFDRRRHARRTDVARRSRRCPPANLPATSLRLVCGAHLCRCA